MNANKQIKLLYQTYIIESQIPSKAFGSPPILHKLHRGVSVDPKTAVTILGFSFKLINAWTEISESTLFLAVANIRLLNPQSKMDSPGYLKN